MVGKHDYNKLDTNAQNIKMSKHMTELFILQIHEGNQK